MLQPRTVKSFGKNQANRYLSETFLPFAISSWPDSNNLCYPSRSQVYGSPQPKAREGLHAPQIGVFHGPVL
jgi:hypothetical protein